MVQADVASTIAAIDRLPRVGGSPPWAQILDVVLREMDCPLGSIHLLGDSGELELTVHRGLPAIVVDKVRLVPIGKGMAGIAAQRKEPVQVCNLQTDTSGVVRPGAKETKMEGAIACPMLQGSKVLGVLGVAKPVAYEFTAQEVAWLRSVGDHLAAEVAKRQ